MNRKYTHIFFDLDNTLWDFKTNSRLAMEATFSHFKLEDKGLEFEKFFETYSVNNAKLWTAYRNKEIKKKELTRQRFSLTLQQLGVSGIDADEMNSHYLDEMPHQKELMAGCIELLEYLRGKRYKLFIITNGFKEVQYKKLQSSGLGTYFEKVFISEEIKCPKPGKEIFEQAITSTNAKKSKSVMIGDDCEVDIVGALDFGIDAIYYNPKDEEKDHCARSLKYSNDSFASVSHLKQIMELF